MSNVDKLAAAQNGTSDPIEAAQRLEALLGLPEVGMSIRGARIVGRGSTASADLYLSDGTEVTFERLRDFANSTRLAIEIAACTGATPNLRARQAIQALALLRSVAQHHATATMDAIATDWGLTYLQAAPVLDADWGDQAERWGAFQQLEHRHPIRDVHADGGNVAAHTLVIRHHDGTRYVRCEWFRLHVRAHDVNVSPQDIAHQMARVGWLRRGTEGRIKAVRPGFKEQRIWMFYVVPPGWENAR